MGGAIVCYLLLWFEIHFPAFNLITSSTIYLYFSLNTTVLTNDMNPFHLPLAVGKIEVQIGTISLAGSQSWRTTLNPKPQRREQKATPLIFPRSCVNSEINKEKKLWRAMIASIQKEHGIKKCQDYINFLCIKLSVWT